MKILQFMGAAFLLLLILAGIVLATGAYPVAADRPHWLVTEWFLTQVRERSIDSSLQDIIVPDDLDTPKRLLAGAGNYDSMCSGCHLKPGIDSSELYLGLYPQPPKLSTISNADAGRQFWTIKHGLKMTGMPAWGTSHSDADIWSMVAFLQQLPGMNAQTYAGLVMESGGHQHAEGHHEQPHDDDHHPATAKPETSQEISQAVIQPPSASRNQITPNTHDHHDHQH